MRKSFFVLLLFVFVFSSVALAGPVRLGGGLNIKYYNSISAYNKELSETYGYEANPSFGLNLFALFALMDNFDLQAGLDIAPKVGILPPDAPSSVGFSYTSIYANGIINFNDIGAIRPFCGAGINLSQFSDEDLFGGTYTFGLGYQLVMGMVYANYLRCEFGWSVLVSGVEESSDVTIFSNTPYFKVSYILGL